MIGFLDILHGSPRRQAAVGDILADDASWTDIGLGGRKTLAGTLVNEDLALTSTAWLCGSRILAEGCGMLKLTLYKGEKDGSREPSTDLPGWDLTKNAPNPEMHQGPFFEGRTHHQVNWGNGFAEIERLTTSDRSPPVALWPIHPSRVSPITRLDLNADGAPADPEYKYKIKQDNGNHIAMKASEILHFPGALSEDGIWGKSLVAYAREVIGLDLGMVRYGATFFGSAKAPPAVVFIPGLGSPDARKNFRREWKEIHGSSDSGEVALLPVEGKYQQIGARNDQGQFLESRIHAVKDVARVLNIPVHLLKEVMGSVGYNGLIQLTQEFVDFSLMTWLVKQAGQCDLKLLTTEQRAKGYFYAHDLSGLLRGDQETRYKGHEVALRSGFKTINQVCREENMPGIGPAGDLHFVNAATTTAERIEKGEPPPSVQQALPATPAQGASDGKADTAKGADGAGASTRLETDAPKNAGAIHQSAADADDRREAVRAESADETLPSVPSYAGTGASRTLRQAARAVLAEALGRLFTKEAKEARRKSKSPDFEQWLHTFETEHRATIETALAPALGLLQNLGSTRTAAEVATVMTEVSARDLSHAFNHDSREDFNKRLDVWHHRAGIVANTVMETVPETVPEPVVAPEPPKKKYMKVERDSAGEIIGKVEWEAP